MYRKKITVRQLSILSGISKSTIHNIVNEKHSPTMDNMEKLAVALKISISELYESPYK